MSVIPPEAAIREQPYTGAAGHDCGNPRPRASWWYGLCCWPLSWLIASYLVVAGCLKEPKPDPKCLAVFAIDRLAWRLLVGRHCMCGIGSDPTAAAGCASVSLIRKACSMTLHVYQRASLIDPKQAPSPTARLKGRRMQIRRYWTRNVRYRAMRRCGIVVASTWPPGFAILGSRSRTRRTAQGKAFGPADWRRSSGVTTMVTRP